VKRAVLVLAALWVLASCTGGGGGGGSGQVAGRAVPTATARQLYEYLSTLPKGFEWNECPLIPTDQVDAIFQRVVPSQPLQLAQRLVAPPQGGAFRPEGTVDIAKGSRGGQVSCVWNGGEAGLQLIVAVGPDMPAVMKKLTKGEDVQHKGGLSWGTGGLISTEQRDVIVGVMTTQPGVTTEPLPADKTYRIGVAVVEWARAHLTQVTTTLGPPTCNAVVKAPAAPGAEGYARALIDRYRAVVPIDRSLARGNGDDVQSADVQAQIAAEDAFVAALGAIHFEGPAATRSAQLIDAERAYQGLLRQREQARAEPDGMARFRQPLQDARDNVSGLRAQLRTDVGLPQSTCSLQSA
jgi:hypothetical protein